MGFNFSGLIINKKLEDTSKLSSILETSLQKTGNSKFEEALSASKEDGVIDVLYSEQGTLVITEQGAIYDLEGISEGLEVIQFIISEVSDTYYLEKAKDNNLVRKYISSQGEIVENQGDALSFEKEEGDFGEQVWTAIDEVLGNDFSSKMEEAVFHRYAAS